MNNATHIVKYAKWATSEIPFEFEGVIKFRYPDAQGYSRFCFLIFDGNGNIELDYYYNGEYKYYVWASIGNVGEFVHEWVSNHPNYSPVFFDTLKEYLDSNIKHTTLHPVCIL